MAKRAEPKEQGGQEPKDGRTGKKRQRGHNEGTISQLPDGRWWARVDLGYVNGKRTRKAYYGKTRAEVADQLTEALAKHNKGLPILANERQTVAQFLERWLEHTVKPTSRPRTYTSYAMNVRLHIVPELGRHRLAKLNPQDVQALLNRAHQAGHKGRRRRQEGADGKEQQAGLSPRSVQYLHAILRAALNEALRFGLVERNVAKLVRPPRGRRSEVQALTPEQARALLDAARGDRLEALYSVAAALGLRQGEALGLTWADVDLEAGTLTVRQALQRVDGKLRLGETKTDRSRRTLSLPNVVWHALREHRRRQLEERLAAGSAWLDLGLVFCTELGLPLDRHNVSRGFHRLLKRAGLPQVRFHDLRHTAATLLLAQGVELRAIMETLGHSQISLTANLYTHVMPAMKKDIAAKMDAILSAR